MSRSNSSTTQTGSESPGPPPYHAVDAEDVLRRFDSSDSGLTASHAAERLIEYGPNALPRGRPDGPLVLFWRQINSPLIWVLLASAAVAMLADWHGDGLKNGLVIFAVVAVNSVIGFVQEYRAGRAIESLTQMMPELITVTREGRRLSVPVADLAPGDVVHLSAGDRVPADARLLSAKGLSIEEAALTGESIPAQKSPDPVAPEAVTGDRSCMVYAGTLVKTGVGVGVVTATGPRTELGRISSLIHEATDIDTPMTQALRSIGLWISIGIVAVAVLILIVGVTRTTIATGDDLPAALRETLIFAIALAVGAIPEGLPAIVTIALAIGVQRMSRRRAIVRRLPAVETLGSTTVICSDKTGTLTRNEMTVRAVWATGSDPLELEGVGYEPMGRLRRYDGQLTEADDETIHLVRAGALCNDATLLNSDGRWLITGDPTEGALVVAARKLSFDEDELRSCNRRLDSIPFESERQFMATLHEWSDDGPRILVKGAPEVVRRRCAVGVPADFSDRLEGMAQRGLRVLAVAERPAPGADGLDETDITDLRFLGLVGMIDPPRQEAIDAVAACKRAGIRVKMITGDHRATAAAIARQLGLLDGQADATQGAALDGLDAQRLRSTAIEQSVFARVAPEHKLKLVRALQDEGQVVAMTGDGVNDAPALKQSNIGVAMGITGTSVSKEAAAVVLTDDNFASIAAAVEEGRRVYDNLVKSLAFVLPTNIGLALILVAAVAFFPFDQATGELLLPMSPIQLLWINLVATVALALPLAFEAAEPNVMSRPPRKVSTPILSRFVVYRTFLVAALMSAGAIAAFLLLLGGSNDATTLARAQTAAVTTVIFFQIFYLFNCRSLRDSVLKIGLWSNPAVFVGVPIVVLLQSVFIYFGPMQSVFVTASLSATDLLWCALIGALVMPIVAIEKYIGRRTTRGVH
ncbi:MAG: cation-translocating P-type ATPase [Phycisphaerales bacterium]